MKIRFTLGEVAPAKARTLASCFSLGGLLVDLDCELDEAKHAVRRARAQEAAIALEGAALRAKDVKREFPEFAAEAGRIFETAKPLSERLMGRRDALGYEEQRDLEMQVILMEESVSGMIGDARRSCGR
jgi:hypothetical protein